MKQRVLLKGEAGLDLLHRISTVDIKHLKLKQKTAGLLLSSSGKIISYFQLELLTSEQAEIHFEDAFLEHLDQMTFGERYEIETLAPLSEEEHSEWDRIQRMEPKLGREFFSNGETNPLEVNLRALIADQKGCYPGQEVIEKIISIGSPSRRLCLLKAEVTDLDMTLPAPLLDERGSESGTLTSFVDGSGLGILKRTHLKLGSNHFMGETPLTLVRVSE